VIAATGGPRAALGDGPTALAPATRLDRAVVPYNRRAEDDLTARPALSANRTGWRTLAGCRGSCVGGRMPIAAVECCPTVDENLNGRAGTSKVKAY
jgi:hypothetical protein